MISTIAKRLLGLLIMGGISAFAFHGGDIGNPLERKASWFSYVGGDDMRASCSAGSPDRFRVVYNGVWGQQLRMYEADGVRRIVDVKVTREGSLMHFTPDDILSPWQAAEAQSQLSPEAYDQLVGAFTTDGMFVPPNVGLDLPSRSYFWSAAWCKDGNFGFTAWKYPSSSFAALGFPALLLAQDTTGIPMVAAEPVPVDPVHEYEAQRGQVTDFTLTVGRSGLVR